MFVIAGLGNPEARYARNRHNIGFEVVQAFAEKARAEGWRSKFQGEILRATLNQRDVLLVRPMTYMNRSGECIQPVLSFFRIPPSELLVVHDELDLPFGTLRLKFGGGHAGHNGLRSIIERLGQPDFIRLRVGIGKPPQPYSGDIADYVLSDFDATERQGLPDIVQRAVKALRMVLARGVEEATKTLNTRPKTQKKVSEKTASMSTDGPEKESQKKSEEEKPPQEQEVLASPTKRG